MSLPLFVRYSDFESRPLFIQQSEDFQAEIIEDISDFFQESILKKLLGQLEYQNFESDYVSGSFTSTKWDSFANGSSFDVEGKTVIWGGVRNMLKHFIYCHYHINNGTKSTIAGEVVDIIENGFPASLSPKVTLQWNRGVDLYGINVSFNNKYFDSCNIYYSKFIKTGLNKQLYSPSAYNFLYNYGLGYYVEFPDWEFTEIQKQNEFGI